MIQPDQSLTSLLYFLSFLFLATFVTLFEELKSERLHTVAARFRVNTEGKSMITEDPQSNLSHGWFLKSVFYKIPSLPSFLPYCPPFTSSPRSNIGCLPTVKTVGVKGRFFLAPFLILCHIPL